MTPIDLIFVLITYILIRETTFIYSTHKMVNKIMSRSFHDYEFSKNVSKTLNSDQTKKIQEEMPEDLSPIQNFGMN